MKTKSKKDREKGREKERKAERQKDREKDWFRIYCSAKLANPAISF
jgi:hypothetical protein